jgi:putative peptide-modifying radical SAM enzyme
MLFILIITGRCNLNCVYCGGSIDKDVMPPEMSYSVDDLSKFLNQYENYSIAFYGGEPLLRVDLMEEIIDKTSAEHYILQTNGLLLEKLSDETIEKLDTILISIDGVKEVNDVYRRNKRENKKRSTYDVVIENVRNLKGRFDGDLIARMVVTDKTDIYRDVRHLLNHFNYVHWQLNVVWVEETFYNNFDSWIESYKNGVTRLVEYWLQEMEKGNLLGIVPFLGITSALMGRRLPSPPCGSGVDSFTITTDGRIVACPICAELPWNHAGDIWNGLKRKTFLDKSKCKCRWFDVCGGRCLFFNRERLWGEDKIEKICSATIHLIEEIKKAIPKITKTFKTGDQLNYLFSYPPYNNTTEIIP